MTVCLRMIAAAFPESEVTVRVIEEPQIGAKAIIERTERFLIGAIGGG